MRAVSDFPKSLSLALISSTLALAGTSVQAQSAKAPAALTGELAQRELENPEPLNDPRPGAPKNGSPEQREQQQSERQQSDQPEGMLRIPAGSFEMGSESGHSNEKPATHVNLSAYEMDRNPVTVSAYKKCVAAKKCPAPGAGNSCNWGQGNKEQHPINCVNWHGAKSYCEWRGARLPTEAEWEYAAKGHDARKYPWGNEEPEQRACWRVGGKTCQIGEHPKGDSPFGIQDMAGNVWEWIGDWYQDSYPGGSIDNPHGPSSGSFRVLRGGSWFDYVPTSLRTTHRSRLNPDDWSSSIGFRCARSGAEGR